MPHRSRCLSVLAAAVLSLLSPPRCARATTFVAVADEELARRAALVAEVRVLGREAAPTARPATDYRVEVERELRGHAAGSVLLVRLPGGAAPGAALRVWGAPRFRAGERAILFLTPGEDGGYRLVDLMLGAFHEVELDGRRLALRDLSETRLLAPGDAAGTWGALAAPAEPARDLDRFADWIAGRAPADYRLDLPPAGLARAAAALPRAADDGDGAAGAAAAGGPLLAQLGPASVGSEAIRRALESLDVDGQRTEILAPGGAQGTSGGLERFDGVDSVVLGGAAAGPDLAPFRCAAGGLVALSGVWRAGGDGGHVDHGGRAAGGDVIFAAGAECLLAGAAGLANARALVAYEAARAFRAPAAAVAAPPSPRRTSLAAPAGALYGAPPAAAPPRGYRPRACGLDMNRNGIPGEPADCHVCDGTTLDPDHDGIAENQIYVSCQTGTDSPTCGSPGRPCRTIGFAWSRRTGPASSAGEDIVCFRGTCHEDSIAPGVSGKPGVYVRPRAGTEARDWQLPKNPTMLVGWDYNHNGQYPPYDTADVAVLDGAGLARAIALNADVPRSYVELAHFTVRDYGRGSQAADTGFISFGGAAGISSYVYLHDLSLQNVNQGRPLTSGSIVFDLFTRNTQLRYVAVENVEVLGSGGYVARGSGPSSGPDSGPLRFARLTFTGQGCNDSGAGACGDPAAEAHVVGWKLWGYFSGVEVLDSVLDLNAAAWRPHASGFGSTAFLPAQCSRDWTIRNNEIRDFKVGLTVQGYAQGFCDGAGARPVDAVVFDRNVFRNTFPSWIYGDNGVVISGGGPNARTTVGAVQVSNNFFSSAPGWQGMLYVDAGNRGGPDPGAFRIVDNTTVGNLKRAGFGAVTLVRGNPYLPQAITWKNNIVAGLGAGQEAVHAEYAPALWDADANVYAPGSVFTWNGNRLAGVAGWRAAARADRGARLCTPSFADAPVGNFHLLTADACARGEGLPLGAAVATDIDGRLRPASGWDAGAHQVSPAAAGKSLYRP